MKRGRAPLSQNFLMDANIARKIVAALTVPEAVPVVEIGPGRGILTRELVKRFPQVVAVEVDPLLANQLPELLGHPDNLQTLHHDFLQISLKELAQSLHTSSLAIIGNLPYHLTSPILFKLLDHSGLLTRAVVMVQKEVAERLVAKPGNKQYGILSVQVQYFCRVEYLFTVPARVFRPQPQVDSAVVKLAFRPREHRRALDEALFRKIVRGTFAQRRKMIRNTLSNLFSSAILENLNFDLTRRPESFSVDEFVELSNVIYQRLPKDHGAHDQRN